MHWPRGYLKRGQRAGGLVLLYHRVADLPSDPQALCVKPRHLEGHLDVLRKIVFPLSLGELATRLCRGDVPRRAVAVTFDDGYADNFYNAKPLLERYDIPATFFVTTGYVDAKREFFWDLLEGLLLSPGTLPHNLKLVVNGKQFQWNLSSASQYCEPDYLRHREWNVLMKKDPTPRQQLYRLLCQLLRPLRDRERCQALGELFDRCGRKPILRSSHRPLSAAEVASLDANNFEVGSHTMTHPVLSAIPLDEQEAEIYGSKAWLHEILGHEVSSFAYPFGSPSDYSSKTAQIVQEAGFRLACENFPGLALTEAQLFHLPRHLVRDWEAEEFARRLEEWFGD